LWTMHHHREELRNRAGDLCGDNRVVRGSQVENTIIVADYKIECRR
jgi:hypothetical protein